MSGTTTWMRLPMAWFLALGLAAAPALAKAEKGENKCAKEFVERGKKTFGFEVEYVPKETTLLWNYYRPDTMTDSDWLDMTLEQRNKYADDHKAELAPVKRQPCHMIRTLVAPAFLPERLIMDETENWEIIGPISGSYGELEAQIKTLEKLVGPGSYQAHVVNWDMTKLEIGVAGYTLFSADLLALRKLTSQLERMDKTPGQVPGAFLLHNFLSVFNSVKKEMLLAVVKANLAHFGWNTVVADFAKRYPGLHEAWREDRPYYKYTLANTYRTDIYGNEGASPPVRWGFEVRGAHKSLDTLLIEVKAIARLMRNGFHGFRKFTEIGATDVAQFDENFSEPIRKMARAAIAVGEADDPKPNYLMFIMRPFEQYADTLGLDEEAASAARLEVLKARTEALETLSALAERFEKKEIDAPTAKKEILIAVAKFAKGLQLLEKMEDFLKKHLADEPYTEVRVWGRGANYHVVY